MSSETAAKRSALRKALQRVEREGLANRVHFGVSLPQDGGAPTSPGSSHTYTTTHGAEEAFPPDVLLRPSQRPSQGRLIEITGEVSSGRTALAQRTISAITARGELAGWVDLPNSLDPRSLMRAGTDLSAVLWVRPPEVRAALRSAELLIKAGFAGIVIDLQGAPRRELGKLGPPVWTRLLRAVRQARCTALLLSPERLASSFATLGLVTARDRACFEAGLLEGLECRTQVLRDREAPCAQRPEGWPAEQRPIPFRLHHRPSPAAS